jgi:hypothetical protein
MEVVTVEEVEDNSNPNIFFSDSQFQINEEGIE